MKISFGGIRKLPSEKERLHAINKWTIDLEY